MDGLRRVDFWEFLELLVALAVYMWPDPYVPLDLKFRRFLTARVLPKVPLAPACCSPVRTRKGVVREMDALVNSLTAST